MQLTVTEEEARVLTDLLNGLLPVLREEFYKAESYDLREQLKSRQRVLKTVLVRLGALLGQPRPC
ncbi:MAG TPA: hypothetical protein VGS20_13380 [Candidatus Acidoferrales bacterium]|nr:hypothetical protein [Candidatus Acidoferrales bacterium]